MKNDTRFVFDTNVIISGLLFDTSVPGQALTRSLIQGKILVSEALIEELNDVLGREKFVKYVTREERERFLESLILEAEVVDITESIQACRDPKDDRILELAVSGGATYVITGDRDLLALNPFLGVQIVTPASLLKSLDQSAPESEA